MHIVVIGLVPPISCPTLYMIPENMIMLVEVPIVDSRQAIDFLIFS